MDKNIVVDRFNTFKKEYILVNLKDIYSEIYSSVCKTSAELLANKITSLETRKISDFYTDLEKEVMVVAYSAMEKAGVQKVDIPIIWARVRHNSPAPHACLCNQKDYPIQKPTIGFDSKINKENNNRALPGIGKWILISGAVVEILAWIFIPSSSIWAPIVRGIGLVAIAGGVYKTYTDYKDTPKITLTEEARKKEQEKSYLIVKEICSAQCNQNCNIYCKWVDKIVSEILKLI